MSTPTMDETVAEVFKIMRLSYGSKFDFPPEAITGWSFLLSEQGATTEEVRTAALTWTLERKEKWPPSLPELLGTIPRFCRCGKCWPCNKRAQERATRLANAGCFGGIESLSDGLHPMPMPAAASVRLPSAPQRKELGR